MSHAQDVIISIRLDDHLARTLENIPNRSAFIRQSVELALWGVCPTCRGSGEIATDKEHVDPRRLTHSTQNSDVKGK